MSLDAVGEGEVYEVVMKNLANEGAKKEGNSGSHAKPLLH